MIPMRLRRVVLGLAAPLMMGFAQGDTTRCDEFGCDGNLCDTDHPCNRGCKCVYPVPGKMGYCQVWYRK
jgi:hypothetical protein